MGSSGLARLGRRARLHKGLIATSLPQRQDGLHRAGQPWENSYIESFNARLRDELLDGEIFYTLREARIVMERLGDAITTRSGPRLTRIQAASIGGIRRVAATLRRPASLATLAPKPTLN